jgi:hypothetical protein
VDRVDHADSLDEHFMPRAGQTLADYLQKVRKQFGDESANLMS